MYLVKAEPFQANKHSTLFILYGTHSSNVNKRTIVVVKQDLENVRKLIVRVKYKCLIQSDSLKAKFSCHFTIIE